MCKIVNFLSDRADAACRYQGGHNAGHTLIVDGKKSIATKIFDESLELLKERIQQYNISTDTRGKSENLYSLATLTKDEIFIIALRKAQP